MKNFLLFILILAYNISHACGYYPYGENTRISLLNPLAFGYSTYSNFNYSADLFSSYEGFIPEEFVLPNKKLWFEYCRGKVDLRSIDFALYQLPISNIDKNSQNVMIDYLYQQNDTAALNYLRFAKTCEFFNSLQEDPWERKTNIVKQKRSELMHKAILSANHVFDKDLKKRYAFLAIRLAWYNNHFDIIQSLFDSTFKNSEKDILYYWSLYFNSFTEKNDALANFELAQVFANAVDKRFACHQHFNSKVPVEQTLKFAKSPVEKANVYLLHGIEKPDKALLYLQNIYKIYPSLDGLSFLLLREINKIEDYVLTPYYTLFQPSVTSDYWVGKIDNSTQQTLNRSERDRLYAKEVLDFVNSIDLLKVENPFLWQYCKAYLQFITRDYDTCLSLVNQLEKSTSDKTILNQLQIIKALALTANQVNGNAKIHPEIQSTILANQKNEQFIFAIGKELEYLGNTTEASLLYSTLDNSWDENSPVSWKTIKNKKHSYTDYFQDYFDYMDVIYTPEQTQFLIDNIQKNKDIKDSFSVFIYKEIKEDLPRLYDLLGTKYIRQNKLENALVAFYKINQPYLSRYYSMWEDKNNVFDKNPFYHLKYTPKFINPKDTILLNKYTITKQLLTYLKKAENTNEIDRDYYYFLVANAYHNMGHEGNVSMMRRINTWSRYSFSLIEDEAEFRQSILAKKYYLHAKQHAKTDKFKALCLRMLIRCENYTLGYKFFEDEHFQYSNNDSPLVTNQYYKELHEDYHDFFDDLVSSCDNFESYFNARR
ncbi:MAG TPA: hypothetical protein PLY70_05880 [Saprospiraceae bacterium]|nr:hypothetical protein [Saprospiraceae bacterium]HPN68940.1 hypothetical protein [Saprospiraceae bacterium]